MSKFAVLGALVVVIGSFAAAARADLVVPGQDRKGRERRPARSDVVIDAGALQERIAVRYRIAKGDTLEGIAKAEFGDRKFLPVIRALNPEVEGDAIVAGQYLRLPPKKLAKDEALETLASRVLTLWTVPIPSGALEATHPGVLLVDKNAICVLAVPGDRLAEHLTAETRWTIRFEAAKNDAHVARTKFLNVGPTPAESDCIVTVTLKLASMEGQTLAVEESRTARPTPTFGGTVQPVLVPAMSAALALGLILLIARSRRAALRPASA